MNLFDAAPAPRVLVTGAAGFIGFHTAARLLDRGDEVGVGLRQHQEIS